MRTEPMAAAGRRGSWISGTDAEGFSLIELLIVVAIMLVVAAMAIPTMVTGVDAYQVRGRLSDVANLAQACRTQALHNNASQRLFFTTQSSGQVVLFVEPSTSSATSPASNDLQIWLPTNFSLISGSGPAGPGAPSAMTGTSMWGSNVTPNLGVDVYYNSRGLPCLPVSNGTCKDTTGFLYYLTYHGTAGRTSWAAVSVSPAGRIQSWFWNGTSWGS